MASSTKELIDNEDVAELKVSLCAPGEIDPKKFKKEMSKTLQSWANKNSIRGEFTVSDISEDGKTAVISVWPAEALHELQNMPKIVLNTKEKKRFSLTPIKPEGQSQDDKKSSGEYSSLKLEKALNDDDESCRVAFGHYWYMKNFHADKIERIEKENGVKITENVAVSIKAEKKHADCKKALDDFIELVQSCLNESRDISFPLKEVPIGPAEGGAVKKQAAAEAKKDEKDETCPVCLDNFTKKKQLKSCKHEFCEECLERSVKSQGAICPVCKDVFGQGDQPDGKMSWRKSHAPLPGYEGYGRIEINYDIPSGTQTAQHPNPGQRYTGLNRTAYLPDNKEGHEVLLLLIRAFDQRLIFTVGTSRTTGISNVVTWSDIHHKTSVYGGPQAFAYPDPNYLSRVKEELKAKGVK